MVIGPKAPTQTRLEEQAAYELATLRDGDVCQRCHRDCGPTARDHRKNRSQGGMTLASNLQVLGLGCHQWKSEHPLAAIRAGWAVPSWADPAEWPARRWVRTRYGTMRQAWVLYDMDGEWLEISVAEALQRMGRAD